MCVAGSILDQHQQPSQYSHVRLSVRLSVCLICFYAN